MTTRHDSRTISVWIDRAPAEVYAFAADPANMPRWASGVGEGFRQLDGEWVADTPAGQVVIRFCPRNDFGVLDHSVWPSPDQEIYIPLRVIANGTGSEVAFTLFRLPAMTDEQFDGDAEWVHKDLQTLKGILER